jgi:hypothetical protein
MEPNTEISEKTQVQMRNKIIAAIIFICVMGGAWYFFYFVKTPEYSLNIIKESVEKHDIVKFKKHVDLDSSLSRGYDDLILAMVESDKTMPAGGKAFVSGFAQMLKPSVVGALKDGILRFVETGKWEADKKEKQGTTKNGIQQNINSDEFVEKTGLKNSSFKGNAYTKKDGKMATVGLRIFESEANKELFLDIKMRELDDGSWQIAEISNLKEYILEIEKAKSILLKKYIEDTKPIIDKHNKTVNEIGSKIRSIAQSSTQGENKKSEIKNIIERELIPDWNARIEELNKATVPAVAKNLHGLRLKVCESRIKQFEKGIEWITTDNAQTNAEIRVLAEQANNTNQQVLDIVKKVEQN